MSDKTKKPKRFDHQVILDMVEPNAKVLDLGCGDGALLSLLKNNKNVKGTGIEINEQAIYECMAKGLTVSHGDIDTGLEDFSSNRFDFVILNESLQEILHPRKVILEALRVGKKVIVGIPNFCTLTARFQIFFSGRVPVTKDLPHEWYDTPNLRFLSIKDFRNFCHHFEINIVKEVSINNKSVIGVKANLFANIGIFLLEKE